MISRVLYTTEATVEGGRGGHAWTSDGRLDVELDVPAELGGFGGPGTNPEQLFAAAYAACFHSSLLRVAAGRQVALPTSRVTSTSASDQQTMAASASRWSSTLKPPPSSVRRERC